MAIAPLMKAKQVMSAKSAKLDQQHREFVKAARELGCDGSRETFDKVLKRVARLHLRPDPLWPQEG
jgi:hemerythrin